MERNKIAIHRRIYARWRFEISGICPHCLKEVEQLSEDAQSIKSEHIVGGIVFVNMPSEDAVSDEKLGDVIIHGTDETNRNRARPVTC